MAKETSGYQEVEIPIQTVARYYHEMRANYLRVTGAPRNDQWYPCFLPPGSMRARKLTAAQQDGYYAYNDPASDFAVDPAAVREAPEPVNTITIQDAAPRPYFYGGRAVKPPAPPPRFVTEIDKSRFLAVIAPAGNLGPATFQGGRAVAPSRYPTPIRPELVGVHAVEDSARHGRALVSVNGAPLNLTDSWWIGNPIHAYAPAPTFAAAHAAGFYGWNYGVQAIDFPQPVKVLIRDPHPWIPAAAMPVPAGPNVAIPLYGGTQVNVYRPVMTTRILVPIGKRRELRDTGHGLMLWYTEAPSGNYWGTDWGRATIIAGIIIVGPSAAFAVGAVAGPTIGAVLTAAVLPLATGLAIAPTATAEVLAEIAKGTQYLAGFDLFYGQLFRELAIIAQGDIQAQNRLRLALAKLKGDIDKDGGLSLVILHLVVDTALAVTSGGASEALSATYKAAQVAIEQAIKQLTDILAARNEMQLLQIVNEKVREENLRQLTAFLEELNARAAAQGAPPAPTAPEPVSSPGAGADPVPIPAAPASSGTVPEPTPAAGVGRTRSALAAVIMWILAPLAGALEAFNHGR